MHAETGPCRWLLFFAALLGAGSGCVAVAQVATQDQQIKQLEHFVALLSEERIAEAERFLDETELRSDQSKTPLLDSSINSYAFSSIMLISSYLRLNDHVNAERVAKDRVDWAEQQYGRGSIQVASFLRLVADIGRQQGKYKEIEPLYVRSLSIHRSLGRAGCLLAM